MAHDSRSDGSDKEQINGAVSDKEHPTESTDGYKESILPLDRRSALKITSLAATAGIAGAVNAVGTATAEREVSLDKEYDTWTISGQKIYDLSDGEVLKNVLVDQTADGASLMIRAQNKSGWEIRNVGFMGSGVADDFAFQLQVSVPEGGNGLIENAWETGRNATTRIRPNSAGSTSGRPMRVTSISGTRTSRGSETMRSTAVQSV